MQPLIVRRASEFEKVVFGLSAWVGSLAVTTSLEVSKALEQAWPTGNNYLFAVMALGGIGGLAATWRSSRLRTIRQIRLEVRAETYALAIIGLAWFGYSVAAFSLGASSIAAGSLGMGIPLGCLWRVWDIHRDMRKVTAALDDPCPASPPPLGDPGGTS